MRRLFKENEGSIMVEFAFAGIMFIGFVFGIIVTGTWIYNVSQVSQAARIAAHNIAVTNNENESEEMALKYLNKMLIACPFKGTSAFKTSANGYGVAEAYMNPLFPGFQKLIDPFGSSTINGRIHIRREATRVLENRFRAGSR